MSTITVHVHCFSCGKAVWLGVDPRSASPVAAQAWRCLNLKCGAGNTTRVAGQITGPTKTYSEQGAIMAAYLAAS